MQDPDTLWREFPLDPAPSSGQAATAQQGPAEAAPEDDAADGRIELPGGASITFPAANGTERAIGESQPPPVAARAPAAQAGDDGPVDVSGLAGLYVVLVIVLVVLMARWLLNHTWRAALTIAVMVVGVGMLGLILMRWATDLGLVG